MIVFIYEGSRSSVSSKRFAIGIQLFFLYNISAVLDATLLICKAELHIHDIAL